MTRKVLFVATVDEGHILKFHVPYLKYFKENGFEVHVACSGNSYIPYCDKKYNISFKRSPYSILNMKAYRDLKKVIEKNCYDIIHCHTPVGGCIGRLASRNVRRLGSKVIYTAHGFHFFKGAPLKNWLLYYPVEKLLSRYTDCLITINNEDYSIATNRHFKAGSIMLVHGVGVDLNRFKPQTKENKSLMRKKYGYREDDFILFYAAELNHNKHQDLLIEVVNILKDNIPNIKLLLAGDGEFKSKYKKQVEKLSLNKNIEFLGYRDDISNLLMLSDIGVASSRREGLPVNVLEAMATGLPLVVTNVRGHRDLINNGENGYVVPVDDANGFADAIEKLYYDYELREKFGTAALESINKYSLENVMKEMETIYIKYLCC